LDLLMAQGYFVVDQTLKEFTPELLGGLPLGGWYSGALAPSWPRAHEVVRTANGSAEATVAELKEAAERKLPLGRFPAGTSTWRFWVNFLLVAVPTALLLLGAGLWLLYGGGVLVYAGVKGLAALLGAAWSFAAGLL